ncbi:unnamed protein product [Lota lota]
MKLYIRVGHFAIALHKPNTNPPANWGFFDGIRNALEMPSERPDPNRNISGLNLDGSPVDSSDSPLHRSVPLDGNFFWLRGFERFKTAKNPKCAFYCGHASKGLRQPGHLRNASRRGPDSPRDIVPRFSGEFFPRRRDCLSKQFCSLCSHTVGGQVCFRPAGPVVQSQQMTPPEERSQLPIRDLEENTFTVMEDAVMALQRE